MKSQNNYGQSQKSTLGARKSQKFTTTLKWLKFLKGIKISCLLTSLVIELLRAVMRVSQKFIFLESYLWPLGCREDEVESLVLFNSNAQREHY